jgi:hypothetical protein
MVGHGAGVYWALVLELQWFGGRLLLASAERIARTVVLRLRSASNHVRVLTAHLARINLGMGWGRLLASAKRITRTRTFSGRCYTELQLAYCSRQRTRTIDIPARHSVARATRRVRRNFMFGTMSCVEKLSVCRSSGVVRW